jgi:hypothetical protein
MTKSESKFTRVYEDEHEKVTWAYDLDYYSHGPISVEIKSKNEQTNGKKNKNTRGTDNVLIENEKVKRGRKRQERG